MAVSFAPPVVLSEAAADLNHGNPFGSIGRKTDLKKRLHRENEPRTGLRRAWPPPEITLRPTGS